MSSIEDKVCEKIQKRSDVGKSKYGVTMERTDLSTIEWLTHLQEELMDAAVYVEKLLARVKHLSEIETEWLTMWATLEELNLTSVVRKNMAENGFTFETDNEV